MSERSPNLGVAGMVQLVTDRTWPLEIKVHMFDSMITFKSHNMPRSDGRRVFESTDKHLRTHPVTCW